MTAKDARGLILEKERKLDEPPLSSSSLIDISII
jgi:hypothetical protein